MHFRLFHNTFIADLSGKWKLSRVLTPFVTGPEDRKSFRVIGPRLARLRRPLLSSPRAIKDDRRA